MEITNEMVVIIINLIAGFFLLFFGGDYLVKSSVAIASKFKMSKLLIGLTVVAFGTSSPELLVSVSAALKGNSIISLGNVVGSNIANIGLIIGITALIYPIDVKSQTIKLDFPVMFLSYILLMIFFLDGNISALEGVVFILGLIVYVFIEFKNSKNEQISTNSSTESNEKQEKTMKLFWAIPIVIASLAALTFGADVFINGAVGLAKLLKVSEKVISLTIVAVGTSLPELFASLVAAFKKENEIALGNIIGSNIFNILGIIGVSSIIKPLNFDSHIYFLDMIWMFIFGVLLFVTFMPLKTKKIARVEGLIVLLGYIVYTILLFVK